MIVDRGTYRESEDWRVSFFHFSSVSPLSGTNTHNDTLQAGKDMSADMGKHISNVRPQAEKNNTLANTHVHARAHKHLLMAEVMDSHCMMFPLRP